MAPSKGAVFVQPNVNSMKAKPYLTWHLNWQTRLNKERMVSMPPELAEDAMRHPEVLLQEASSRGGFPLPVAHEACPIGGAHSRNNTSKELARTLGGLSWKSSGGMSTSQAAAYGEHRRRGNPREMLRRSLERTSGVGDAGAGQAQGGPRRSRSTPQLGDSSLSAEVMRAAPNRSVASILRAGDEGTPEPARRRTASGHGRTGHSEDFAAEAAVMRAAPQRSIASILRAGNEGLPGYDRIEAAASSRGGSSHLGHRDAQDVAAEAMVMRAAPQRSVAAILRAGEAGLPEHRRRSGSSHCGTSVASSRSGFGQADLAAAEAAVLRAAPQRSVAAILRAGDAGLPKLRGAASSYGGSSPSEASTAYNGHHGRSHSVREEDRFAAAEVMRAAPQRSVASILRAGEAGFPQPA